MAHGEMAQAQGQVSVRLLGGFTLSANGRPVTRWQSRRAAELVQLLLLQPTRRLAAEQLLEALWPNLPPGAGRANLRKAAHHARESLGDPEAVVLRGGCVSLFPGRELEDDVARFLLAAEGALASGEPRACEAAAALYGGELLPEAIDSPWTEAPRRRLREVYLRLLRAAGDWERLAQEEPGDEAAHQALMRAALGASQRSAAVRWYARLRDHLARELGLRPSPETESLLARCLDGLSMRPAFVGRALELGQVLGWLGEPVMESREALLLRGAAGMGKSALCRRVAEEARGRGWSVWRIDPADAARPYGLVSDLLQPLLAGQPSLLQAVGPHAHGVLAALVPGLPAAAPLPGPLSRHQVVGALQRALLAAAGGRGALLMVDDLQACDEASLEAVLQLVQTGGPLAVLMTCRPAGPQALERGLARLRRGDCLRELALGPLGLEDATELARQAAGGALDGAGAGALAQRTQGHPFALIELARAWRDGRWGRGEGGVEDASVRAELVEAASVRAELVEAGAGPSTSSGRTVGASSGRAERGAGPSTSSGRTVGASSGRTVDASSGRTVGASSGRTVGASSGRTEGGAALLSSDLAATLLERLCDVDADALEALRRLALAADVLDAPAAIALAGEQEPEALARLDQALAGQQLELHRGRYRFRHALLREALLQSLPPHRIRALHEQIAQRLEGVGAAPGLIAQHWLAARRATQARPWAIAAAREAARLSAFGDMLSQLRPLLRHLPHDPDALALQAEAMDALAEPGTLAAYEAAAAVAEPALATELRAKRALAQVKMSDPQGGLAALAGLEPVTVAGRLAAALAYSGAAALGYGDPAEGARRAAESRRLAMESGDTGSLVIASWAQAAAAHSRGDLHGSVWADLHETAHLPHLALRVFDGHLCITQRFLYGSRPYPQVIAFAEALAAEARRLGAARGHAFAVTLRGEARLLHGQLDAAERDLREGQRLHRAISGATGEALALQRLAELALVRGQPAEARALLADALDVARQSDVGFHLLDRIYGTRIRLARGPDAALAALEDAEASVRGPLETCPGCRITFAVPATIAAAQARELDLACNHQQSARYLADVVMKLPAWYAALHEAQAHVALASGQRELARQGFAAAARGFEGAGQPIDAQRCRDGVA